LAPANLAAMNGWDTIFTAGSHTDTNGVTRYYSNDDLDRVVQAYNPENHEAPLVIGHPKTDSPAYGWVEKLRRVGGKLQAKYKQVHETAKKLVSDGSYKHKSVALYKDGSLRHVGLLGAKPPAVKGLGAVAFTDGDEFQIFEYSEGDQGEAYMNELEETKKKLADKEAELKASQEATAEAEKTAAAEKERADQAEADKAKSESEFSEHRQADLAEKREAKFAELVSAEKLMPGDKDAVLGIAESLAGAGELEFSEGDKQVKVGAEETFWQFLKSRKPGSLLGEFAEAGGDDGESDAGGADYAKTF
jgi:hypothetical protein